MTMSTKSALGAVVAVLVAAGFVWSAAGGPLPVPVPTNANDGAVVAVAGAVDAPTHGTDIAMAAARSAADTVPAGDAPRVRVRGRLVDENGRPLAGLAVELRGAKPEAAEDRDTDREYGEWVTARGGRRWADQTTTSAPHGAFEFVADPTPLAVSLWTRRDGMEHGSSLGDLRTACDVDLGDLCIPVACSLALRVVDQRGAVVPTPRVTVHRERFGRSAGKHSLAPRDGTVRAGTDGTLMAAVVAGEYLLDASNRTIVRGETVTVPPGVVGHVHELVLATVPDPHSITGTVVDERGNALPDVDVLAHGPPPSSSSARTDPSGRFHLLRAGRADGIVEVLFTKAGFDGHGPRRLHWNDHDVRVVLQDLAGVAVRVVDARGEPVVDYAVRTWRHPVTDGRGDVRLRASGEHPDGRVRIEGLTRGSCLLVVEPDRRDLWRSEPIVVEATTAERPAIEVRLARATDRSLRVRTFAGAPVHRATVELIDSAAAAPPLPIGLKVVAPRQWEPDRLPYAQVLLQQAVTDSAGRVRLHGPAATDVVARIAGDGFAPFLVGPFRLDDAAELAATVPVGGTFVGRVGPPELVKELIAARKATGRDPGFRLQRGAGAAAEVVPPASRTALQVDADGSFSATGVPPGEWQVALEPWDHSFGQQSVLVAWPAVPFATVTLREGERTDARFDLRGWVPARLTGIARCGGRPVAGARVWLTVARPGPGGRSLRTRVDAFTDDDGRFRYVGRGGTAALAIDRGRIGEHGHAMNPVASLDGIQLVPGTTVEHTFDVVACAIRLRLVGPDGAPHGATAVALGSDDGALVHPFHGTDADGWLALDTEPAAFQVVVGPHQTTIGHIQVRAGATNEFTVVVPAGVAVR